MTDIVEYYNRDGTLNKPVDIRKSNYVTYETKNICLMNFL